MTIRSVLNSLAGINGADEDTRPLPEARTATVAEPLTEFEPFKRGDLQAYGDYRRNEVESSWAQQQQTEPTPDELSFFARLDADKGKDQKPRIPASVLSGADPKMATEDYLRRVIDNYYVYYKDINDLAAQPDPRTGKPANPPKPVSEINALKAERTQVTAKFLSEFQKLYDEAYKSVAKEAKKTPMSEAEISAKATEKAVQRWNSRVLYSDKKADEKTRADSGLTLFVKGKGDADDIDLDDVNQGQIGDCFILAAIGAAARQNPERIRQMITDNGDGTYNVRLYKPDLSGNYVETIQTVDGKLIGDGHAKYGDVSKVNGKEQKEAWAVLIEKAYVQATGSYKDANKGGSSRAVLTALTGREARTTKPGDYKPEDLAQLSKDGKAVVLSTPENLDAMDGKTRARFEKTYQLVTKHAYILSEIKKDEKGNDVAVLYNPWGTRHAEIPLSEIRGLLPYLTTEQ